MRWNAGVDWRNANYPQQPSVSVLGIASGIGVASVSYGMTGSAINLPGTNGNLTDLVDQGKDIPIDALRVLCLKLKDE